MKSIQNFLILLVIFYINGYFAEPIIGDEKQEEFNLIDNSNVNSNKLSDEIQRSELEQLVKTLLADLAKHQSSSQQDSFEDSVEDSDEITNKDDDNDHLMSLKPKRGRSESQVKRGKNYRKQQAAQWDIGFGKRAGQNRQKSFLDALYGKRNTRNTKNSKSAFGRKQQWDITYGK